MAFSLFNFISFEYPEWLWIAVPLFILSVVITFIRFMKIPADEQKSSSRIRWIMIFTRALIIGFVVLALTGPFYSEETTSQGDPTIMLLIDNSTSMELFDADAMALKDALETEVPVTTVTIASLENSRLGDAIFRQLQHQNLLLLTDGNNQKSSMNFIDLAGYAEKFNTTINSLELGDERSDTGIQIDGPRSSIVDTDYFFTVELDNMGRASRVSITVDGQPIFEEQTELSTIELNYQFTRLGNHKITATLEAEDYFLQNNEWYHIVEVVEKPKILYMGYRASEFDDILPQRYDLTSVSSLPSDLSSYFAVVVNDVMHDLDSNDASLLEAYTDEGNGLLVWGGLNSFQGPSDIDYLLPLSAGETVENDLDFNFIFVVDMSGIVELSMVETEIAAAELIDILADRKEEVNIGVVDFSYTSHIIYPLSPGAMAPSIKQAMNDFQDTTTIDGTLWLRPAALHTGLATAREMFVGVEGNNNIIIVTDGNIHTTKYLPRAVSEIDELTKMGVRVHTYDLRNEYLDDSVLRKVRQYLSSLGGGMFINSYFSLNSLFEKALIVSNHNHYITSELVLSAVVTGENKVSRSPSGKTLITTGTGLPIVAVNSYNKVGAVATDDGYEWAEDLTEEENEHVIYRIFDWAIGDPNRKKASYTRVAEAIVGQETKVSYKGTSYPTSEKCTFLPIEDHYECSILPTQSGFDTILGTTYAVNYQEEYQDIGYNQRALNLLTERSGGSSFDPAETGAIISKVKSDSKVRVLEKHALDWYLLAAAMIVFLFEIFVRRVLMHRKS
jgi:hypothetical protein